MGYSVYLHIPYCASKCRYCDFYSAGGSHGVPQDYVDALLRSWRQEKARLALSGQPSTLYFGGGTPGLLSVAQVEQILQEIDPLPGAEITLETNPELATRETLEGFRRAGINRLSFGVQSGYDESLARLGRRHTAEEARQALRMARQAGFDNLSGDIMLALPHYSKAEFDATLSLIAGEGAAHISAYLLKIEPNTVFGRRPPEGLPDEDEAADYYLYAVEQLEKAGYHQYEISNFARPGYEGRHNLAYWNCRDYLGIGPAAHSCIRGERLYWPSNRQAFIEGRLQQEHEGVCDVTDYIMLRLRLTEGLDLSLLKETYGVTFTPAQLSFLHRCQQEGYARFDGDILRLTPAGLVVQNSILSSILP